MTNTDLHNEYYNKEHPQALRDSYLRTLRGRANNGSAIAKQLVNKIDKCKCK